MVFKNDQANITFDESVPCVVWTPTGFLKGEQFREPFKAGMDFLEEKIKTYPTISWLNDARSLKTVGQDDVKWLNQNVNDRAYKLGVKKVAFVLPESIFGKWAIKLYVDFTQRRSDNKLEIKAFATVAEAKKWLKEGQGNEISFL